MRLAPLFQDNKGLLLIWTLTGSWNKKRNRDRLAGHRRSVPDHRRRGRVGGVRQRESEAARAGDVCYHAEGGENGDLINVLLSA